MSHTLGSTAKRDLQRNVFASVMRIFCALFVHESLEIVERA